MGGHLLYLKMEGVGAQNLFSAYSEMLPLQYSTSWVELELSRQEDAAKLANPKKYFFSLNYPNI